MITTQGEPDKFEQLNIEKGVYKCLAGSRQRECEASIEDKLL